MVKPAKRTAATSNKKNEVPVAKSTRVTRGSTNNDAVATKVTKVTTVKKAPTVPKKRKIEVPEPVTSDTDENIAPSSSQESNFPKRGKKERKQVKERDSTKDQLPLLARSKVSGSLLAVGSGDIGQLGLGVDVEEKTRPGLVTLPEAVCSIMAGGMHSICLTKTGRVYTFGCNDEGALGRLTPNEDQQFVPDLVEIDEKVVQVSAGDSHCGALTESGKVYIWGNFRDFKGQMGLMSSGSVGGEPLPVQILNDVRVVQISSGGNHFLCLDQEGNIHSCGCCEHGQLGRINIYNLERGGRKGMELILRPDIVSLSRNIKFDKVWGGIYSSFARSRKTGDIYAFGLGNFGQLGKQLKGEKTIVPKPTLIESFSGKTWTTISSGNHHTLALDSTGTVYSLGKHDYGRLGLGNVTQDASEPTLIPLLEKVECVDISCGTTTSYAVATDGSVYSWGSGANNMLGHDTDDDILEPRKIVSGALRTRNGLKVSGGGQHALFIASDKETNGETNGK